MSKKKSKSMPVQKDKQVMSNTGLWPMGFTLPLKRLDNRLDKKNLGFLSCFQVEHGRGQFVVYHAYVFDMPKTEEARKAIPTSTYQSVDELLADGWEVD